MISRRVLITGASRGLGAALTRVAAMRGHALFVVARNGAELTQRAQQIAADTGATVHAHAADLRDAAVCRDVVTRAQAALGGVDVLINSAGIGSYRPFTDNSPQDLIDLVALNLTAPMLLAHALLPAWDASGGGYLINIASDLARRPLANMAPYVASKYGLLGFGASLHRELRGRGLRVTTVLPGIIDTAFNGAQEGSKQAHWALPPLDLAARVIDLLDQPPHLLVDELVVHPIEGDY